MVVARSSMRAHCLVSLGAVLATVLASPDAARAGDAPSLSDLPVGRFTSPPKKKPAIIAAGESVPGIFVTAPKHAASLPAQHRYVSIATDMRAAEAARVSALPEGVPDGCVTAMHQLAFRDSDATELEWEENLAVEAHAYARTADNPMSGVIPVHTERLVEQNGSMMLESVDAWIDPQTRGARLIARGALPLKLVRTPGFGMKVYAGRDERPDGKRFVQFVVVRSATPTIPREDQMWAMREEGVVHSSGCGHQRVALRVDGEAGREGETATVVATTVLPEPDRDADRKATRDTPPAAPAKTGPRFRPGPSQAAIARFGLDRMPGSGREVRTRMMHIQVSVSQTSRDREPLVSVSSSWAGREQVERFVEPDSSPPL